MEFFGLIIASIISIFLWTYLIFQKNKTQLQEVFIIITALVGFWDVIMLLQKILCDKYSIFPIIFEYFTYISTCFLPVFLLFLSKIFTNTKINFKFYHLFLFIIPIFSLCVLWTNNIHHLFYKMYSINLNETVTGPYAIIHILYTYSLFATAIGILLTYSIKNAGFFSKQSLLIIFGTLIPIVVNILGTFGIIPMTVYVTPICFSFTILFFALAIFKFKFLSVTPIAMQRIVDRMSDSFLVLNEDNVITDFNDTLLTTFDLSAGSIRNQNFIKLIEKYHLPNLDINSITEILEKCKTSTETFLFKSDFKIGEQYFNIEVSGIFSKNAFLGNLILLKDVTQHILDMKTIEENQSMLMEKERLASLGQMIGGIAHNLKTPIMSIAGATEGLKELTHEYDISIGDPEVTEKDHHDIVKDMDEWIRKIKEYTEYMSDVITAVKGQAVNFSDETGSSFTIGEAIKYIDVLMKHELKNALVNLNTNILVDSNLSINGNINSFVQVINNMISNAIQSYNGKPDQSIDFTVSQEGNSILFTIQDYGVGIPKKVKDKLFKEMITTKGKNGTGLGLFMSYSNIRAHFGGDITFDSEEGKGTKFMISIPIK